MSPYTIPTSPERRILDVRCVCADCGAHFIAWQGRRTLGGSCGNCGSYNGLPLSKPHAPVLG